MDAIDRQALLDDIRVSVVVSGKPGAASAELRGVKKVVERILAAPGLKEGSNEQYS